MTRNRRILVAVLNGISFKDIGILYSLHAVTVRTAFHKELKNTVPEIWKEGRKAGWYGTYATPSLMWLRANKDRILIAPEALVEPKKINQNVIKAAIKLLEKKGFVVTHI